MASIKINQEDRQFLLTFASESIQCPAETKADKDAYAKAAPLVRKLVEERYPPKDMKLLLKYEQARHDACIRLQLTAGGVVEFRFRDPDKGPLVPGSSNSYGCRNRMYAADDAATAAIVASLAAAEALIKARNTKLSDYQALISASSTLEQIEDVWPAGGAALRPRKGRSLPVILSDEVIARIKADASSMARAA